MALAATFRILPVVAGRLGAAVAVMFWAATATGRLAAQDRPDLNALAVLASAEQVLADVIQRNERSLVAIARVKRRADAPAPVFRGEFLPQRMHDEPGDPNFIPNEFATGVVIDARGLVLTNYHILDADSDYWITTAERKTYRAKVKAADFRSDLAVLEMQTSDPATKEFAPIKFGDAATLKKGHIVITLGNPYAIARDGQPSASWGIVSNLARKAAPNPTESQPQGKNKHVHYGALIQTDARLALGASGGAMLNLRGEMVGLTTSVAALAGYEQTASFAIPVDQGFLRIVETLKRGQQVEYGFLGVELENLAASEIRAGRRGVTVNVVVGTPAHRAGLQNGDLVTGVNGKSIHDADSLFLNIGSLAVDSVALLTVERNGRVQQIPVQLAKSPDHNARHSVFTPEPMWRGLQVDYSSVLVRVGGRRLFDPALLEGCVAVVDVSRESPAWECGLRPGMLITHVDGARVQTPKEFREAVKPKDGEVTLRLGGLDFGENPVRQVKPDKPAAEAEASQES